MLLLTAVELRSLHQLLSREILGIFSSEKYRTWHKTNIQDIFNPSFRFSALFLYSNMFTFITPKGDILMQRMDIARKHRAMKRFSIPTAYPNIKLSQR